MGVLGSFLQYFQVQNMIEDLIDSRAGIKKVELQNNRKMTDVKYHLLHLGLVQRRAQFLGHVRRR